MEKLIIDAIQLLLIIYGGYFTLVKAVDYITTQHTKRREIEAKENSLGHEALLLLKSEISDLKKAKGEDDLKIKRIEQTIDSLEFIYKMIEQKMLSMFPNQK